MQISKSQKTKGISFTLIAGALWGTSFPIIKIGLETIDPIAFVFWRFFVSSTVLLVVMAAFKKLKIQKSNLKLMIFLGIANAVGYLLQYVGMPYTSAAKAALFINLSAIWVALLSPKLLGENFSRKKIAGIFFGLLGIVFVSTNLDLSSLSEGQFAGDLALIVSGVTWAIFMIYNKKLVMTSTSETFQSMTWVLVFTFTSIVPFIVLAGPGFFNFSIWAWLGILWTAIICWIVPYYLWLEGLKHLSASVSTVLLLSEIVVAIVLSIVILKESITVISTIGTMFIVLAIVLVSTQDKRHGFQ